MCVCNKKVTTNFLGGAKIILGRGNFFGRGGAKITVASGKIILASGAKIILASGNFFLTSEKIILGGPGLGSGGGD